MDLAILCIGIACLIALIVLIILVLRPGKDSALSDLRMEVNNSLQSFSKSVTDAQNQSALVQEQRFTGFAQANEQRLELLRTSLDTRLASLEQSNERKLEQIRSTMEHQLVTMRNQNAEKLTEMQNIVDEKLQKTLEDQNVMIHFPDSYIPKDRTVIIHGKDLSGHTEGHL